MVRKTPGVQGLGKLFNSGHNGFYIVTEEPEQEQMDRAKTQFAVL